MQCSFLSGFCSRMQRRWQVARQSRPRVAAAHQHTHVGPLLVPGMCAPAGTSLLVPAAGAEPLSRLRERAPFTVCFPATTSLSHNVYNIQLLALRSLRSALQSSINVPFFEAMIQSLVRCLTGLRLSEFLSSDIWVNWVLQNSARFNVLNCRVAEVPQGDRMCQNQLFF